MFISKAEFVTSSTDYKSCPDAVLPEYAFIGRSNVGKSSLINMLTGKKELARTSGNPGKTQCINHFIINDQWYLVDLPGIGFAKVSKPDRKKFKQMIYEYLSRRVNLLNIFFLIDSRIPPQKADVEFIEWMGINKLPFSIVFTKTDKLTKIILNKNINDYKKHLLETWEELPPIFLTSAVKYIGKTEILKFIEDNNKILFKKKLP